MLAPPPKYQCAFGLACDSSEDGKEKGSDICSWCCNMSLRALHDLAASQPDHQVLVDLVNEYRRQLEIDNEERIQKGWLYLCACKDPRYRSYSWRRDFNPRDFRSCGFVRHRGQLCSRCFMRAQEQGCTWLEEFDGDRLGFPCVFENTRLRRPVDANWRAGPADDLGRPYPEWEKDPERHGACGRTRKRHQLCQGCYERICEIRGFTRYFDDEWGTLHDWYKP